MTYALTNISPRPYQEQAHRWAMNREQAVVCLPTGTGKTLVGCTWVRDLLNGIAVDRVLVLEPSRFLVEQTAAYYQEYTTIPTAKLDGTTPPSERREMWNEGQVVVTTPHTAVNDVHHLDFDAVVVDECHHTTGQHAFAQLLKRVTFAYKLGLSATIPVDREREIETAIGPVRRRSWTDLPDEHVPEWLGHIYDTPYASTYREVVAELEDIRVELDGSRLAGLPTLGIRMLCRDGALALAETLSKDTTMADILHDRVAPPLQVCPPLHKLDACRDALADHSFEKAVLFVDRVAVAQRLATALDEYTTVSLLGRLHSSRAAQEEAVAQAQSDETDIIVATAAGEEGIDLPAADLLVVWSNVVSSVRFIQRLGRIMRPSGSDAPRNAVYLATPDSPDYEALRRGVAEAHRAGLDIAHMDVDTILSRSIVGRVQDVLESTPRHRASIAQILSQPDGKIDRWLRTNVRDGDVFYLYSVPDNLTEWRKAARGMAAWVGVADETDFDTSRSNRAAEAMRNNFSPGTAARYYLREADVDLLKTEYPTLVDGDGTHRLEVSFGPSHQERGTHRAYGDVEAVVDTVTDTLADAADLYATVTYRSSSPPFSFQMQYQGSATDPIVRAIARNADAVATTLTERLEP